MPTKPVNEQESVQHCGQHLDDAEDASCQEADRGTCEANRTENGRRIVVDGIDAKCALSVPQSCQAVDEMHRRTQ